MGIAEELAEVLRIEAASRSVIGAAAGVLVDGECFTAAVGVTSIEHPLPVDASTLFQVGSISKTFTSAAIAMLVEDGRLSFDDPVSKHVPDLGARTGIDFDAITVEHALSHQAGFDGDHLFVSRQADSLDALRGARQLFGPGTEFSYNNAMFSVAGEIVAAASGQPYETFVRERLLAPLGMKSATFRADDAITNRVALPHFVAGDDAIVIRGAGWQPGWELGPVDRAAGGLIASVDHMLEWCRFQTTGATRDGRSLLSHESLVRLHRPLVAIDATSDVGLDWFVESTDGVTTIGHGGLTAGYCSELVVVPDRGVGVVALTNSTNGGGLNHVVRRWALERAGGIREQDPVPDAASAVDVMRVTGRYLAPFGVLTIEATAEPGTIRVTTAQRDDVEGWKPPPDPPMTFGFFADDHVISLDAPGAARIARFGYGPTGHADWVLWGLRRAPRLP